MSSSDPRSDASSRATELLGALCNGDGASSQELLSILYGELHRTAALLLLDERREHTLQPTALVHEAWLRLVDVRQLPAAEGVDARRRFMALAARAMRNVLIDHARRRGSSKRGGGRCRVELDDSLPVFEASTETLLDLEAALDRLAGIEERLAVVAELRLLGGLSMPEVAAAIGVSLTTAKEDWTFAQALLARWLESSS
ncbi:MAG: RNA polymerase subunit sigma-70 [Planctomycetes bacterium]|nr:RNA polymerase subunit sigma-70 [Planctomycetota bacterium]